MYAVDAGASSPCPLLLRREDESVAEQHLSVDAAGEGVAAVSTPQERGAAAAPRRAAAAALRGRPAGVSRERGA